MNITMFWSVTSCNLINRYVVSEERSASVFCYEDGGITFLQNVGEDVPDYTASHLRRQ
jgi:hypothetical protein